MNAFLIRLAIATTILVPFVPAYAADVDLPPVRPSIVSLGVIGGLMRWTATTTMVPTPR